MKTACDKRRSVPKKARTWAGLRVIEAKETWWCRDDAHVNLGALERGHNFQHSGPLLSEYRVVDGRAKNQWDWHM
jgi:hypothetical protein